MRGGLSLEVQMYGNVGPCYCQSGLLLESLITVVSHHRFHCTVYMISIKEIGYQWMPQKPAIIRELSTMAGRTLKYGGMQYFEECRRAAQNI